METALFGIFAQILMRDSLRIMRSESDGLVK